MEQLEPLPETIVESVNPYPLTEENEDFFTFTSDHDINYAIWFADGPLTQFLQENYYDVAEFSFMQQGNKEVQPDSRIGVTVAKAIRDYLDDPKNLVVYICDNENNRGLFRQRLFKNWHSLMGEGFEINQFQPTLRTLTGSLLFYTGIIFRSDCPERAMVVQELQSIAPAAILKKIRSEQQL